LPVLASLLLLVSRSLSLIKPTLIVLAFQVSQKLIGAARDVSVVVTREQQRFFMIPFRLFDAAVRFPSEPTIDSG